MHSYRTIIAAALGCVLLLASQASSALSVGVSINIAPPPLPVYVQPDLPGPGYIWSPGYWGYGDAGYYWVPGTWVLPPQPGYLWTPGYWGWGNDGAYLWHGGYWGEHVGFYGGVNYGFGYGGIGFEGGYWQHGAYFYNRSVNRIPASIHVTNVYNKTVVNNVTVNRVSFNGGNGGIQARPTPTELAVQHEAHLRPVAAQMQHEQAARGNPALRASFNHGNPGIAATAHPGVFSGQGVVAAHGAMAGAQSGASAHGPGRVPANFKRGPGAPAMNNAAVHHDGAQGGGQPHANGGGQGAGQPRGNGGQAQGHQGQPQGHQGHPQGREGEGQGHERPQ